MAREILKKVLDISSYQGTLSDDAISKIKSSGVGVILRMGFTGYGSLTPTKDSVFDANVKKLKAAGVPVGAYYFTIAYNTVIAAAEVDFILNVLSKYQWELPFYLDVEGQKKCAAWSNINGSTRASMSKYILENVQKAGYYVGIYSSKHGFTSSWLDMSQLTSFDKWVAQYNSSITETSYKGQYGMWQYSSKEDAKKYGITKSTYVDISNAYYDFENIIKSKGLNNFGKAKYITCPHCGGKVEV